MRWKFWKRNLIPDYPPGIVSFDSVVDTGEILMGPVDFLGTPIKVFSRIAYPGAYLRNKVQMVVARITEFTADGGAMVQVESRSREPVGRSLVHLTATGLQNVVVIG